ncbi:hypothetical protein QVD17_30769 [Tagetes erecta]|uniref:Uncharacterized protein n=1 Tax=Tagetes erecta TaxID=13708 RepID=A0AAD8K8I4_TARER|nr:hypothetical protein QVD17_30769 [Tagetes erecta]
MAVPSPCCCRIATSSHFPSLPSNAFHRHHNLTKQHTPLQFTSSTHTYITLKPRVSDSERQFDTISPPSSSEIDCVGTGADVECVYPSNGEGDYEINVQETKDVVFE